MASRTTLEHPSITVHSDMDALCGFVQPLFGPVGPNARTSTMEATVHLEEGDGGLCMVIGLADGRILCIHSGEDIRLTMTDANG